MKKDVLGSEILRIEGFKNKISLLSDLLLREIVEDDKESLEYYYAGIARQMKLIPPIMPVFEMFRDKRKRSEYSKFYKEVITLSIRELFKDYITNITRTRLIEDGILVEVDEALELSDDYIKGKKEISRNDWDTIYDSLSSSKIKLLQLILSMDDVILSQFLINVAIRIPKEKKETIDKIYAVDDLLNKHGYKYLLENRKEIGYAKLVLKNNLEMEVSDGERKESK